jgi:HrpA-like RNA helicase
MDRNMSNENKPDPKLYQNLSIMKHEKEIISCLDDFDILIITGHTGCGKSTKIPQFLYDYKRKKNSGKKNKRIIVTQPRRIATVKMSKRVSEECEANVNYTGKKLSFLEFIIQKEQEKNIKMSLNIN